MKKIVLGVVLSFSFTTSVFAANSVILERNEIRKPILTEFCCHTADVYVGNENYGAVTSCAATCEAAQTEWNNVREQIIEAVKEKNTSVN